MHRPVAVVVLLAFATACAPRRVYLHADPPSAKVRVNGADLGQTPATFLDNQASHMVEIEAEGYKKRTAVLTQATDGGCVAGWIIGGLFVWPLLFGAFSCNKLPQDQYHFSLEREPAPAAPRQVQDGAL